MLPKPDVMLFDFGDTLVEFNRRQWDRECAELERVLSQYGPCSARVIREQRAAQRAAPGENGWRENDLRQISAQLFEAALGHAPSAEQVEELVASRCALFKDAFTLAEGVSDTLQTLASRMRLGVISNYPCGKCVRDALDRLSLSPFFDLVVVSGDVGLCKPHPAPFTRALEHFGVGPEQCWFVGDNWVADIEGSKRLGMTAVHTRQFRNASKPPGKWRPDHVIWNVRELGRLIPNL